MISMLTHTTMRTKMGSCHCGGSDCHGECCTLQCPTKPNFFCGQVLTDDDLKALVDWTSAKSALQRFREGWGVSCGLEVTCSHEPKEASRVMVAPGYAIDCCGRDIVVCDPIYYDFQCEPYFDPCCAPRKPEPQQPGQNPAALAPGQDVKLGCIPRAELRAFDLCLRFEEKLTAGQRPLARGNCKPLDECQYTRVIETGKLEAKEVLDPCVAVGKVVEKKYHDDLTAFLKQLEDNAAPETLHKWLQGKLNTFGFVEECLCGLLERQKQKPNPNADRDAVLLKELLFYIVQDYRNHYFQCLCSSCEGNACEGDGVPLARVWIWNKTDGECKGCKVVQIDAYPPYRRRLARDCSPYFDCVDLSRYIWRELDGVKADLFKLGFNVTDGPIFKPEEVFAYFRTGTNDIICPSLNSQLEATTFPDVCGKQRVVAFKQAPHNNV